MGHLQDHLHDHFHKSIEGGLQDKEEAHYDDAQLIRDEQRAQWLLDNVYYDEVRAQFVIQNLHNSQQTDQWMEQLESFAQAATFYKATELHHLSSAEMHQWLQAYVQIQLPTNATLGYASRANDLTVAVLAGASHTFGFTTHATLPVGIYAITADSPDATDISLSIFIGGTTSGGAAMPQLPVNLADPQADPQQLAQSGVTIDVAGTLIYAENATAPAQGGAISFAAGGLILPANTGWYYTLTNNGAGLVTMAVSTSSGAIPLELETDVDISVDVKSIELTHPDTAPIVVTLLLDEVAYVGETITAVSDDTGVATVAPAGDVTDGLGQANFTVTSVAPGLCNIVVQHVQGAETGRLRVIPVRIT